LVNPWLCAEGEKIGYASELSSRSSLPAERGTNKRINVMTTDIAVKAQEEILSFDVSDEVLEIAAAAARINARFTLGSCTGLSECPG
jgi:hypothetical protein